MINVATETTCLDGKCNRVAQTHGCTDALSTVHVYTITMPTGLGGAVHYITKLLTACMYFQLSTMITTSEVGQGVYGLAILRSCLCVHKVQEDYGSKNCIITIYQESSDYNNLTFLCVAYLC